MVLAVRSSSSREREREKRDAGREREPPARVAFVFSVPSFSFMFGVLVLAALQSLAAPFFVCLSEVSE